MNNHGQEILDTLKVFGADPEGVVFLYGPASPQQINYLDLKKETSGESPIVDAVVSMAGRPTLYAVRGPLQKKEQEQLCYLLSQRGSADHLAVIEPGVLTLFPVVQKGKKNHPKNGNKMIPLL